MWRRDPSLHAKRARELKAAGLTVEQIAERLGVSLTTVYAWLCEKRKGEHIGTLASLEAEAVEKSDSPVIEARRDSADFLYFFCPHCPAPALPPGRRGLAQGAVFKRTVSPDRLQVRSRRLREGRAETYFRRMPCLSC
jgi:excisionase family DNA binding protein